MSKELILKMCKQLVNGITFANANCDGLSCECCPFDEENNDYICCGSDSDKNYKEIAKRYLKDNGVYENEFNWQSFKQGEIEVNCTTERSARDFLKQCDKQGIVWSGGTKIDDNTSWHHNKENTLYSTISGNLVFGYKLSTNNKVIKWNVKENINMKTEKTFKEVIADIKEGEVWESEQKENKTCNVRIKKLSNALKITNFDNEPLPYFPDNFKYKLQRKQYTFTEAFAAYEEGKEIESLYDSETFLKEHEVIEGHDNWFDAKQIRNKWYINN